MTVRGKFFFGVAVSACWRSAASRAVALRDTPKKRIFPGQYWYFLTKWFSPAVIGNGVDSFFLGLIQYKVNQKIYSNAQTDCYFLRLLLAPGSRTKGAFLNQRP